MRLAARRPDLVRSLILMETSAQPEPNKLNYGILNTLVKFFGVASVTTPVMKIMFGDTFLQDPSRRTSTEQKVHRKGRLGGIEPTGSGARTSPDPMPNPHSRRQRG